MAGGHKLEKLDQIGDWASAHVQDTFELDLIWVKLELPHAELPNVGHVGLSKYMLMELIAAVIMVAVLVPFTRRVVSAAPNVPRGRFWNCIEAMLVFIRNGVARPSIGHDADRFVPFLWTVFFFILICNLLGLVPLGGTATSSIETTAALALCTFFVTHGTGMADMGFMAYMKSVVPHVPIVLWPLMFVVELLGFIAKSFALCVRLYANMYGGHMATTVLLGFIVLMVNMGSNWLYVIAPGSIFGVVLLTLFDLFVALLQAYIFTMLSAVFIGMAVHPHH